MYGKEIAAATQVIMEGGAALGPIQRYGDFDMDASVRRQLRYADLLHAAGGRLQWELTNSTVAPWADASECQGQFMNPYTAWTVGSARWQSHAQAAEFNLATALLGYAPGDSVGDLCEYPNTGWSGYKQSLGTPIGQRVETNEGAGTARLIYRMYTGGMVVINQGDTANWQSTTTGSRTVTTSRPAVALGAPAGTAAATSFTLAPETAKVLKYQ